MKNLFAAASYSFSNFYNNLNTQGQMVFSIIIFLIALLCALLFITYVIQDIKNKASIRKIKKNKELSSDIKVETKEKKSNEEHQVAEKEIIEKEPLYIKESTEIENIASAIESAMVEETPISLTNFEEDQEKTAIISIDELIKKAKELEIIDDDKGDVNYLEKYNLEPAEIEQKSESSTTFEDVSNEVKAFKVSQIISPIYGVKKEALENSDNIRS